MAQEWIFLFSSGMNENFFEKVMREAIPVYIKPIDLLSGFAGPGWQLKMCDLVLKDPVEIWE